MKWRKKENSECSRFLLLLFHAATARLSSLVQFTWSCNFTSTAALAPLSCFSMWCRLLAAQLNSQFFLLFFLHSSALCTHVHDTLNCICRARHHPLCRLHNDDDETSEVFPIAQRTREKSNEHTRVSQYNEFKFGKFSISFQNFSSSFVSSVIEFSVFSPQSYATLLCKKKLSMHISGPHIDSSDNHPAPVQLPTTSQFCYENSLDSSKFISISSDSPTNDTTCNLHSTTTTKLLPAPDTRMWNVFVMEKNAMRECDPFFHLAAIQTALFRSLASAYESQVNRQAKRIPLWFFPPWHIIMKIHNVLLGWEKSCFSIVVCRCVFSEAHRVFLLILISFALWAEKSALNSNAATSLRDEFCRSQSHQCVGEKNVRI